MIEGREGGVIDLKIKVVLITTLVVLLFTDLACASTCYVQDGRLYIYDDTQHKMLLDHGDPDTFLSELELFGNYAYAGGYGGLVIADLRDGSIINEWPGAGAAGQVYDIAISDEYLCVGYEDGVAVADHYGNILTYIYTTDPCYFISINNDNILSAAGHEYDLSDIYDPRSIDLQFIDTYLQDGRLYIYDDIQHKMLLDYGDPDTFLSELELFGNYVYAGGYGGLVIADLRDGSIINEWPGAGAAGQVHDIAISDEYLCVGYEDRVAVADHDGDILTYIYTRDPCYSISINSNIVYAAGHKYDISNIDRPRCIDPGVFIAVYDNLQVGTWVVETVGSSAGVELIGFGWSGVEPIVGDWDGDGFKDVGVYNRPGNNFLVRYSDGSYTIIGLGWSGVTPVVGDFDGDGDDDVGVYDNKGTWALNTDAGVSIVGFGWSGVEPVVGDWNGDGIGEVGIYNRPGNNFLVPKGTSFQIIGLGWSGVIPIVGNWDSDINEEVGVYDPKTSTFALAGQKPFVFGKPGSQPVVGDVDSDGITEVGVCRPDGSIAYNTNAYYEIELQKWGGSKLIGI